MMEPDRPVRGVEGMEIAAQPAAVEYRDRAGATDERDAGVLVGLPFEAFWPRLRASAGRALTDKLLDVQLATEATDEAMARAYQHWPKVSTLDSPAGWVYRVGLNWSRSALRRLRRTPPAWLAQANSHHDHYGPDPSVTAAMAALPTTQREVVVCRLLLGLSEAQTATALRLQPGTVKSRLSRALRSLQTSLAHLHPQEPQS